MWTIIASEDSQQMIASFAFFMGIAALYDGRGFFQALVVILMAAFFFCFTLSQLQDKWSGPEDEAKRVIASLEVSLFFGFVTYRGWEGVQLLIGLVVGLYAAQVLQGLVLLSNPAFGSSDWTIILYTSSVLAGAFIVHENAGARKVFGILAPLIGSSLVVSALDWFWMLTCSKPGNEGLCTPIKKVPSVFEFWYMIAYPFHSKAVGYFEATGKVPSAAAQNPLLEPDRLLSLCLTAFFFFAGTCYQLKSYKAKQAAAAKANNGLAVGLLESGNRSAAAPPAKTSVFES
jgi:hypothetical protein